MKLFEECIEAFERRYSDRTYIGILEKYEEYLDGKKVENADLADISNFMWKQVERGLSRGTIGRYLSAIKALYRWIKKYNPEIDVPNVEILEAKDFTRNLPEAMEREAISEQEMRKLINQPENIRDKLLIALFCHTGLRVGEMSGLQLDDLVIGNKPLVKVRSKTAKLKKPRKVPFPRRLVPLCRTWLNRERPSYTHSSDSNYYFLSKRSEKLSTRAMGRIVVENARKAGIQEVKKVTAEGKKLHKVTPHALRHTFGTLLLKKGVDIKYVSKMMGHASIKTTQIYARIDERDAIASYREIMG